MRFRIIHTTGFSYDLPAYESHNEIRLKPLQCEHQRLLQFRIASNQPASILEYQDGWGNSAHSISIHPPHDELSVVVESLVDRVPDTSTRIRRVKVSEYLAPDSPAQILPLPRRRPRAQQGPVQFHQSEPVRSVQRTAAQIFLGGAP